jgi:hypothetical protein
VNDEMEGKEAVVAWLQVLIPALAWKYIEKPWIGSIRIICDLLCFESSSYHIGFDFSEWCL